MTLRALITFVCVAVSLRAEQLITRTFGTRDGLADTSELWKHGLRKHHVRREPM